LETWKTKPGRPLPLGATTTPEGVNFSVFSRNATSLTLVLFDKANEEPIAEILLHPEINKTGEIWHILVLGMDRSLRYGYRADGPFDPKGDGHWFKRENILLDPYARALVGVTTVELMPVFEFNELENKRVNPKTGERLKNLWGYNTMAFFAPKASYASNAWDGNQVKEFKEMVKAFHCAGMEVIIDVVFNHTAEGDSERPVISFRGLDNAIYYSLNPESKDYLNLSGCGNTVNCNHPVVQAFVLDCLRYWVVEMHVDGFRFDLATILRRDHKGELLPGPSLVDAIEQDPVLAQTKIIAEAWYSSQGGNKSVRFAHDWSS